MAVKETLQHLPENGASLRQGHGLATAIQVLLHVKVEELEDKIELVLAMHYIKQVDDARVAELAKKRNFTNSRARNAFVAVFNLDFLERNSLNKNTNNVS